MVTQITPINLIPGMMIPRVNISQYDTGARVLKFQVYNGDSLFTFTNAMTVALVGTKPDGKGFSYAGTIVSNMPTFDVTAQMSAVAGKVRSELVVFENGERVGSGNFVIFVEECALGEGTDMSDSDYAIINDALEAAFDLDHFYADLQNMVTEAVEDIQVVQGQTVIDPTLTISGAAADAKATGDLARKFLDALMTETVGPAAIVTTDDAAGGLPLKTLTANIVPTQSGTGDPSPDNVRAISGYTGVTVTRAGTNIVTLNSAVNSSSSQGITYTVQGDTGTILINGTATNTSYKGFTYTNKDNAFDLRPFRGSRLTGKVICDDERVKAAWTYFKDDRTYVNLVSGNVKTATFVIPDEAVGLRCLLAVESGETFNDVTARISIAIGDTATDEEYNGDTYSVTFPTAAGTVYGGTLTVYDDGSGTLTVDKASEVFDGSSDEAWVAMTTANIFRARALNPLPLFVQGGTTLMSDRTSVSHYNYNNMKANYPCVSYNADGRLFLAIGDDYTTASQCTAWLAENPIQVCYTIAEPNTYALSAVQVAQMLQGDNNIWMDAAGTVQATYYANTALYVEKQIAQLQALVLENQ